MADERNITARFTADTSGFSPKVNELVQRLKSLNGEYEQNQQKIKSLNTEMKSYQKELQTLEAKQRSGVALTSEEKSRMNELRDSIARCATQLGTYRAAQSTLRSDISQTSRELNEQRDAVNGVSEAAASFGDVLKANIISDAIHAGLQKTVELLKSAASYCYSVGSSFEAGMSQVEAISGASGSQLEALTEKANEAARSSEKSYEIIGNTKYDDISDKFYVNLTAEKAREVAKLLDANGIQFSGTIRENGEAKITLDKADIKSYKRITGNSHNREQKSSVLDEINQIKAEQQKSKPQQERKPQNQEL